MGLVLRKVLPFLLALGVITGVGYAIYRHGYKTGSGDVLRKWDEDRARQEAAYAELLREYARAQADHQAETTRISDELAQIRQAHADALGRQRLAYEQRLRRSEGRAALYRDQAEAGAAGCRDLAGHAARLDRALEEGIGLVGELQETLGFRERQLRQLGEQIHADRKLLGEPDGK